MDAATAQASLGNAARSFLGNHQLLIDGKWRDAKSAKKFDVFDPATGRAVTAVAEADAADVDETVKAARRAFETGPWSRTSPQDRSKLIWKLADLLESHADEIAQLEALDNGKPIRDARNVDLPGSYEILRYMAGWATKINGETITVSAPGSWHAYTLREPIGVVGQNHPVEFPPDDGGVEDRTGAGRGLHDRFEAGRADPAQRTAFGPADPGGRVSRRRRQHPDRIWRNCWRGTRRPP
jgi:phenylacetaldehyde dehydrogenase